MGTTPANSQFLGRVSGIDPGSELCPQNLLALLFSI